MQRGGWHLEATRAIVSHSREPSQTVSLPPHAVTDFLRAYSNLCLLVYFPWIHLRLILHQ